MRKLLPLLPVLLAAGCAASGKAIIEQYQDIVPAKYPNAVVVVLENRVQARVDDKGESMTQEGFTRVKILDKKATDCGTNAPNCRIQRAVCYSESFDEVELVDGRTIAPDGTVLELKKDDLSDQTFTSWAYPETDSRCFVYMVKGAAPGAVFEEHYRINTKKILGVGGGWLQDRDPVMFSEFVLDTPADYKYKWKMKNTEGLKVDVSEKKEGNRIIRTVTARDVPALELEDYMVAPDDVVGQVKVANEYPSVFGDYSLCRSIKSWEDMGRCYDQILVPTQKITPAIQQVIDKIAAEAKTDTEKVKAVWKFLNENVRYIALGKGMGGWIPLPADVVCTKKYGDCKAVGNLISVMLRALGVKSDPVLIGIRPSLGEVDTDLPGPFHFNHCIARVEADGKVLWLDATYRTPSYDTTPYADQGVHVPVASSEKPFLDFIPVQPPEQNRSDTLAVFTVGAEGEMNLEATRTAWGNTASMWRSTCYSYNTKQWQDWIENQIGSSYSQAVVTEHSYQGKEDNNEPFVVKVKARIPKALQPTGTGLSFQVKELFPSSAFGYFDLPKRKYPLDMGYLWRRLNRIEVQIPPGMEATGLPRNVQFEDEFVKIERLSQIEGDRVVTLLSWDNKAFIIPPEKYLEARKSFHKVLDATSFVILFEPPKKKAK